MAFGLVYLLSGSSLILGGGFDQVKAKLARPGCHYFEFFSIIESDVFDEIDTAMGTAYIASDGRYSITVDDDSYVYDLENTYTYSESTGQVIVEHIESAEPAGEEIAFILRLDETYSTHSTAEKDLYHLTRIKNGASAYPDSLYVRVDTVATELKQMEYLDINEELNRIVFLNYMFQENCDSTRFELIYPDSADVIKL